MAVIWSDNAPYPEICDYCQYGCQCGSPVGLSATEVFAKESSWECEYCNYGCTCGSEEWEKPGDGGWDEQPECECECECCTCECVCETYLIDADSYNQWVKTSCYACDQDCLNAIKLSTKEKSFCNKDLGDGYNFRVRVMPTHVKRRQLGFFGLAIGPEVTIRATLDIYLGLRRAVCAFTGPVLIPMLQGPTSDGKATWMSLTPMEVFSLRPGVEKAKGNVLIAGLGLGWMTQQVLKKPSVSKVTQIEICPQVAQFFGRPLQQMYGTKVELVVGNVWEQIVKNHIDLAQFDTILFDIWPEYGNAYLDKMFQELKKKYPKKVWGWGDH